MESVGFKYPLNAICCLASSFGQIKFACELQSHLSKSPTRTHLSLVRSFAFYRNAAPEILSRTISKRKLKSSSGMSRVALGQSLVDCPQDLVFSFKARVTVMFHDFSRYVAGNCSYYFFRLAVLQHLGNDLVP